MNGTIFYLKYFTTYTFIPFLYTCNLAVLSNMIALMQETRTSAPNDVHL